MKKPTIEQIEKYADSIDYNLDAGRFFDYYEARGWLLGPPSKRVAAKSWKACVRTWLRGEIARGTYRKKTEPIKENTNAADVIAKFEKNRQNRK